MFKRSLSDMKESLQRSKGSQNVLDMEHQLAYLESLHCISRLLEDTTDTVTTPDESWTEMIFRGAEKGDLCKCYVRTEHS